VLVTSGWEAAAGYSPYKDCKRALRLHDGGHADSHDCQHAG
jgi:hypothetical protein